MASKRQTALMKQLFPFMTLSCSRCRFVMETDGQHVFRGFMVNFRQQDGSLKAHPFLLCSVCLGDGRQIAHELGLALDGSPDGWDDGERGVLWWHRLMGWVE